MAQNLELDVAVKLSLDNASRDIFDGIEKSAKETKSKVDKAFNFGKAAVSVGVLISAFKTLGNAVKKNLEFVTRMTSTIVKSMSSITGAITGAVLKISGLSAVLKGINTAFNGLGNAIRSAISSLDFAGFIKESSELSSGLLEVQNVLNKVFGKEGMAEIKAFSSTAVSELGMTTLAVEKYLGRFGAALSTTGQSRTEIARMSKQLVQMTSDLASFYDMEHDIVAEKLFSGVITGQVKPLRELGVDMSKASLEAYALANGYSTLYKDMTAAEKQALRFNYAMDKFSMMAGDYKDTINSTANQMRLLKNQLKELGTVVGSIINAFLNPLIIALNHVMSAVIGVAKTIASAMGIDWSMGVGGAASTIDGVSSAYEDLSDSADDLSDSEDDVADGISKASKEAKKALAPFHKLNILQNKASKNSSGAGSGAGGGIGESLKQGLENAGAEVPSFKEMIKGLFDWIWGLDWEGAFDKMLKAVNKILDKLPKALRNLFNALKVWMARIVGLINKGISDFNWSGLGKSINEFVKGLGQVILVALKGIHFKDLGTGIAKALNEVVADPTTFMTWATVVGQAINDGYLLIQGVVKELNWKLLGYDIYIGIKSLFGTIDGNMIRDTVFNTLSSIGTSLTTFFNKLSNDEELQDDMSEDLLSIINGIADYVGSDEFEELLNALVDSLDGVFGSIKENLEKNGTLDKLKTGFIKILKAAGRLLKGNLGDLALEIFNAVKDAIKAVFTDKDVPLHLKLVGAGILLNKTGLGDIIGSILKLVYAFAMMRKVTGLLGGAGGTLVAASAGMGKLASALSAIGAIVLPLIPLIIGLGVPFKILQKNGEEAGKALDVTAEHSAKVFQSLGNDADTLMSLFDDVTSTSHFDKLKEMDEWFKFGGLSSKETEAAYNLKHFLMNTLGMAGDEAETKAKEIAQRIGGNLNIPKETLDASTRDIIEGYRTMIDEGKSFKQQFADNWKEIALAANESAGEMSTTTVDQINTIYENLVTGATSASDLLKMKNDTLYTATEEAYKKLDDLKQQSSNNMLNMQKKYNDELYALQQEELNKELEDYNIKAGAYNDYLNQRKSIAESMKGNELNVEDQHQRAIDAIVHDGYSRQDAEAAANMARTREYAYEIQDAYEQSANNSGMAWKDTFDGLGLSIGEFIDIIDSEFKTEDGKNVISDALTAGLDELPTELNASLTPAVDEINNVVTEPLKTSSGEIAQTLTEDISKAAEDIKPHFTSISDFFKSAVKEPISNEATELSNEMSGKFEEAYKKTQDIWTPFIGWFEDNIITPLTTKLTELGNTIEKVFVDSVANIESKWSSLNNSVQSWADSMAKSLNNAARSADKLAESLSKAAAAKRDYTSAKSLRVQSSGRNGMPSYIPGYANGAVLQPNKPHLALLGDQRSGINIESPLSTMVEAFKAAAQNIEGGLSGNITIPVYVDGVLTTQKVITAEQMHNYRSNGR